MKIAKDLRFYKGLIAEILGCLWLILKGYKVLKWNYKTNATAQIDIVAVKNGVLRVVEVKYRKKFIDAFDAISYAQKKRLQHSARHLATKYKKDVVIDGLYFTLEKPFISHKKNIF